MTRFLALGLLTLALLPGLAHAQIRHQPRATWRVCTLHLDAQTMTRVVARDCATYPMPKATTRPIGQWTAVRFISPHVRLKVTYPTFSVTPANIGPCNGCRGTSAVISVTGYSYACGDVNGITANGDIPHVGSISNDWLPFGTHVAVPALHYQGIVDDRGQGHGGFDLFAPSCAVAMTYTGTYQAYIG